MLEKLLYNKNKYVMKTKTLRIKAESLKISEITKRFLVQLFEFYEAK